MGSRGFCLRRGRAAHASPPHQPSGEGGAWGSLGNQRPRRSIPKSQTLLSEQKLLKLFLSLSLWHVYKVDDRGREERGRREKEDRKTDELES